MADRIDIDNLGAEKLTGNEKAAIESKAAALLRTYGCNTGEFVDVLRIAGDAGFVVGNADLGEDEDGFIFIDSEREGNQKFIGVNAARDFAYKRFILAHELGHFCLHYDFQEPVYAMREHRRGKGHDEQAADYFAACLLMPRASFGRYYEYMPKTAGSELELAQMFIVPLESVKRRIKELNL